MQEDKELTVWEYVVHDGEKVLKQDSLMAKGRDDALVKAGGIAANEAKSYAEVLVRPFREGCCC